MPFAADLALVAPPAHVIAPPSAATVWRPVIVKPGDTIWQLAITHRTTPTAIVAKNGLTDSGHLIHVGQALLVPFPAPAAATAPAASTPARAATRPAATPSSGGTYTVRPGDSLSAIAARYRVSLGALASANRLANPSLIFVGQRLTIPGSGTSQPAPAKPASPGKPATSAKPATPTTAPSAGARVHVVVAGDSMSAIAAKYQVSLTKLLAANRLSDPGFIQIGQRISIPAASASSAKPTSTSSNTFAGYTYSDATVSAATANRNAIAAMTVPDRTETAAMIRQTAIRHGVDPRLALAIAWQESGWSQRAVSVANAVGVMQIMPISGEWAAQLAGRKLDLRDTQDNITAGVLIIRALQSAADSREQAIAGYYQGLYSVQTKGLYSDTKQYVAAVLSHYARM